MKEREPVQEKPKDVRIGTVTIERADPTYYGDEKGVRVTATRLIIGSTTYAMANITSVRSKTVYTNLAEGIIIGVIGLVILATCADLNLRASVFILAGVALLIIGTILGVRRTCHLKVTSAAGEEDALISKDKRYINQIAVAANEALSKRR